MVSDDFETKGLSTKPQTFSKRVEANDLDGANSSKEFGTKSQRDFVTASVETGTFEKEVYKGGVGEP